MPTAFRVPSPVIVVSRSRAQNLLSSTNTAPFIGAAVSIVDSTASDRRSTMIFPHGLNKVAVRLKLRFDDSNDPIVRDNCIPPTKEDITKLVTFLKARLPFFRGEVPDKRLLIHCWAGKARSTAAALIGFQMALGSEQDAWKALLASCEEGQIPDPNLLMLQYAQEILSTQTP